MPRLNKGPKLELNSRGVWEIRWTEKRRSFRTSTRETNLQEAQKVFAGWLIEYQQDAERARPENLTVNAALDLYFDDRQDSGELADAESLRASAKPLREGLGDYVIPDITQTVIGGYQRRRRRGDFGRVYSRGGNRPVKSSGTLRRELSLLKTALNHCVKRKKLRPDDMPYFELPPASDPRDVWLTEQETPELLKVANQLSTEAGGRMTREHRFIVIALATAARKRSIERLTWDLVDLNGKLIYFNKLPGIKTNKRRVPVPIPNWAMPWLKRMEDEREGNWVSYVLDNDASIWSPIERMRREVFNRTKNPKFKLLTPHVLRHTRATHMARAGRPLWEIAGILGDTIHTVAKVYIHHMPEHLRAAADSVSYSTVESVI
jgi:integrase